MTTNTHENNIGDALKFYAEFTDEIELVAFSTDVETLFNDHFKPTLFRGLSDIDAEDRFHEMRDQSIDAIEAARVQMEQIITSCSMRIQSDKFVRNAKYLTLPRKILKRSKNWTGGQCHFQVQQNLSDSTQQSKQRYPIYFGLDFFTEKNQLVFMSWLWVKGVNREKLEIVLSKFDVPYSNFSINNSDLYLADISIRDVVLKGGNIESLINQALKPIESIPAECWKVLLDMAKK